MERSIKAKAWLLAGLAVAGTVPALALPPFGSWSAPANIETLPGSSQDLNTMAVDGCASMSRDGLSLAFNSNRTGNQDLYIATRTDRDVGFGAPERLPEPVRTTADEFCPTLIQGKQLYFSRVVGGDPGVLFVSRLGPKGWSDPEQVPGINTPQMEEVADTYEDDEGREVLIFTRRAGLIGKLYQSVAGAPPELIRGGPHSSASDARPSITHDGRTIFWDSTRGGLTAPDLFTASRSRTSEDFGQAEHLTGFSSPAFDARPSVSWDGTMLTFSSGRAGGAPDIWFATRPRTPGKSADRD